MKESHELTRYSRILEKNPREIVLLRGKGCTWKKCRFCDYHQDFSLNQKENYQLNQTILEKVTGEFKRLEVINSGSFTDLDYHTLELIKKICIEKAITQIHFETHWLHREAIEDFKAYFKVAGITVKIKMGIETFDYLFRESYLIKGIEDVSPQEIAQYCDEVCLLQGIPGQTVERMIEDIELGLTYFERVCVNLMVENSTTIKPDSRVRANFMQQVYPRYKDNERIDILLNNIDFGVGGIENE